ncbi:fatty acid desaturase family protein [Enhygromyxa salina]|uniref:fatty acid desaturase family protein n=1 Tax=Enhygromyxa salina TaxID=215803 RepID=UPI002159754D|nr:fatty acid desaturase [Enhygromyxa salina]
MSPPLDIDAEAFARDLDELQVWLRASAGEEDLRHLRKIEIWGRLAGLLGYATAWIAPNPLSIFALSFARFVRWTAVAHPVCHRAYDRMDGVSRGRLGSVFARGRRRVLDWLDWIDPDAWHEEHNLQHHYRLNEEADPDLVERNLAWLRESQLPRWQRLALIPLMAVSWKFVYYAPSTLDALARAEARRSGGEATPGSTVERVLRERWSTTGLWSFIPRVTSRLWLRSWGPYLLTYFVVLPALFTPLGAWAVISVLINSVLAELLTNAHAFVTIVPNHAGEDLYRFEGRTRSRAEFYLRQVLGSTNFRCGGDLRDLMHGWLNYQIEHHLWPDMSMLQYRRAQPRVREICARHGVPYVQESVWRRCQKTVAIMVGDASMCRYCEAKSTTKTARATRPSG